MARSSYPPRIESKGLPLPEVAPSAGTTFVRVIPVGTRRMLVFWEVSSDRPESGHHLLLQLETPGGHALLRFDATDSRGESFLDLDEWHAVVRAAIGIWGDRGFLPLAVSDDCWMPQEDAGRDPLQHARATYAGGVHAFIVERPATLPERPLAVAQRFDESSRFELHGPLDRDRP